MNVRKSWFSYMLWVVSVLFGLFYFIPVSNRIIILDYNSIYVAWAIKATFVILPIILSIIIYKITKNHPLKMDWNLKNKVIFHSIVIIILLSLFLFLRYYELNFSNPKIISVEFFDSVKIGSNHNTNGYLGIINQGFYSYVASFLLMLFGNKIEVLLYLQLILQLITTIAIYIASTNFIKREICIFPAILLCINPLYIENMFCINSNNYNIFILSVLFMLISYLIKKNNLFTLKLSAIAVLTGVLMFYHLNLLGLSLLMLVLICELEDFSIQKKLLNSILYIFLNLLSFGIIYFVHYWDKVNVIFSLLQSFELNKIDLGSQTIVLYHLILIICFLSYMVSFWYDRNEIGHIFILPIVIQTLGFIFIKQFSDLSETFIIIDIMMSFMIAESFRLSFHFGDQSVPNQPVKKENADKNQTDQNIKNTKTNISQNENVQNTIDEKKKQTKTVIEPTMEKNINDSWDEIQKDIDKERKQRKQINNNIDKKAPIENVLPMPKKHVKKTLDYNYNPKEKEMHFDVDLNEKNSDYDV